MKLKSFVTGFLVGSIFFSGLAYGAVQMDMIQVSKNTIKLEVNGEKVNSDNFLYEGRTYVQMREIAEILGKDVGWNGETSTASINEKVVDTTTSTANSTHIDNNYIFDLNENDINYAIDIAKGDTIANVFERIEKEYTLKPNPSENNIYADVKLGTSFSMITNMAAMNFAEYKDFTLDDGKNILKILKEENAISLDVTCYRSSITGHQNLKVIIKQGENIIRPYKYNNIDNLGKTTDTWPDFPQYTARVTPLFSIADNTTIDFSKPIDIIVIHTLGQETVYNVNLSDYK